MKYRALYRQLTDKSALDFLDYYEDQMLNNQTSVPLESICSFNHGQLALKSDYYECLTDQEHGNIYRFTYHVKSYVIVFKVWHCSFGKIGNQKVCLAKSGLIEARLDNKANKEWRQWNRIEWTLLPIIAIGAIVSSTGFGLLLTNFVKNLAWYLILLAYIGLAIYAILCLRYCFKYWHKHKYLHIWLKCTKAALLNSE